jgi:hypothetical protein
MKTEMAVEIAGERKDSKGRTRKPVKSTQKQPKENSKTQWKPLMIQLRSGQRMLVEAGEKIWDEMYVISTQTGTI